ncbi:MAG: hypothetical protein AB7F89_01240 [Pirellulaceae bacterium]
MIVGCRTWLAVCLLAGFVAAQGLATDSSYQDGQAEESEEDRSSASGHGPPLRLAQQPAAPVPRPPLSGPFVYPPLVGSELAMLQPRPDPYTALLRRTWRPNSRLASAPHMFGDFLGPDIRLAASEGSQELFTDLPLVAGGRRTKLSDNNSPVVMDRAYFTFQHFHNVLQFDADPSQGTLPRDSSVNRLVLGFEHVIAGGPWSLDVRIPLLSQPRYPGAPFTCDGGVLGNITLTPKWMFWTSDILILATGLGVDLPTGADSVVTVFETEYALRNRAVHLLPFVGMLTTPTDRTYLSFFTQFDFAAGSNPVEVTDHFFDVTTRPGLFTEQNLLHLDLAGGYWLEQDGAGVLSALATLTELHYTTTLQDSDHVDASTLFGPAATIANASNRQDALNLTAGFHAVLWNTTAVRLGAIVPLLAGDNRLFDAEFSLQINQRF